MDSTMTAALLTTGLTFAAGLAVYAYRHPDEYLAIASKLLIRITGALLLFSLGMVWGSALADRRYVWPIFASVMGLMALNIALMFLAEHVAVHKKRSDNSHNSGE